MSGIRTIEHEGAVLCIELYMCGRDHNDYHVWSEDGDFPCEYDLVTLCDGGDPERLWSEQLHNGGEVLPGESNLHRLVRVFK